MELTDIYRTFHPKTTEYTFFSSAHRTCSRIGHILGDKSSLAKFKKIEIISSIFSDHNTVRLEIYYRKKTVKKTQMLTTIKGGIDINTIIVGDFNPTFTNGQIIQNENK